MGYIAMSDVPKPSPFEISEEDKEKAIQYLAKVFPKKTLKEVYEISKKGYLDMYHMGFGMAVRNALRKGGFKFNDIALDGYWDELITEAARRTVEKR
ncbi:MAG: hypothetical protein DRN37_04935 [Thermoplasmata archaeon]|nr:MAG: hypothetical protein DRN37_04935 [Thermoplasmata archaeon]